jgi:tetratricopeptide (TPR) repeat protein
MTREKAFGRFAALGAALLGGIAVVPAAAHDMKVAAATTGTPVSVSEPLFENLGNHAYAVTTSSPRAQAYFNQGLRWAWAFNHGAALSAFRQARTIDPGCALCWWGEAFVLGPNINTKMPASAVEPAVSAVSRALALSAKVKPNERGLIEALGFRYSTDAGADQATLNAAYAHAMEDLAARFPADDEIATLYADAIMNLSPWDYWLDGGATPKPETRKLMATLEGVLARNSNHPGAIHLYIHTVEASTDPGRAESHADRLAALSPGAGHLVHMPAHIYNRVGRWRDSLAANQAAVAADEAYFARVGVEPSKAPGIYTDGYYPHNLHFMVVSAQMAGDAEALFTAAAKLETLVDVKSARRAVWLQAIKAAPYFAHAQFSAPETVLDLPEPAYGLPYVTATWRYARGVAYAAAGKVADAKVEAAAIRAIGGRPDVVALGEEGLPARELVEIAALIVEARVAQKTGELETARQLFETAAAIEDGLTYMEPAYWYYPVQQSLGAVHLEQGDHVKAEQAFRRALEKTPNNGWALWGLANTYKAMGRTAEAAEVDRILKTAWVGPANLLSIDRL